eukprot:366290-Chlamydomonas_euryale.AAC.4
MTGVVVIGEGAKDEAPMLYCGERIGEGTTEMDIAVDPLDGTTLCATVRCNFFVGILGGELAGGRGEKCWVVHDNCFAGIWGGKGLAAGEGRNIGRRAKDFFDWLIDWVVEWMLWHTGDTCSCLTVGLCRGWGWRVAGVMLGLQSYGGWGHVEAAVMWGLGSCGGCSHVGAGVMWGLQSCGG